MERVSVDVPRSTSVSSLSVALRKGRTEALVNHGSGWIRMDVLVPARGLIGFRTEFLTKTRGTGILHQVFERFEPWFGELRTRPTGALVSDRRGKTTSYAILNLQERGSLFVGPGVEVYEGMIVGENARADDLDVNATKEKKLSNMRAPSADTTVRLIPPRPLSLDKALEYIHEDECVEVTPEGIRMRKVELSAQKRQTAASRKARGLARSRRLVSQATLYRRQRSTTPFSSCSPRSASSIPEPTTRSFTVWEMSTSEGSRRPDPRADVHRHPAHLAVDHLALASVEPGPHLEAHRLNFRHDRLRTADRAGWTVECREEAITGSVDLGAAITLEERPHRLHDGARRDPPARSPSWAAFSVDATMSVNRTVARTRSNSASSSRTSARKESMVPRSND